MDFKFDKIFALRAGALGCAAVSAVIFGRRFYNTYLHNNAESVILSLFIYVGTAVAIIFLCETVKSVKAAKWHNVKLAVAIAAVVVCFLFERAADNYAMSSRKAQVETSSQEEKLAQVESNPMLVSLLKDKELLQEKIRGLQKEDERLEQEGKYARHRKERNYYTAQIAAKDSLYAAIYKSSKDEIKSLHARLASAGVQNNALSWVFESFPSLAIAALTVAFALLASFLVAEQEGFKTSDGVEKADEFTGGTQSVTPSLSFPLPEPIKQPFPDGDIDAACDWLEFLILTEQYVDKHSHNYDQMTGGSYGQTLKRVGGRTNSHNKGRLDRRVRNVRKWMADVLPVNIQERANELAVIYNWQEYSKTLSVTPENEPALPVS